MSDEKQNGPETSTHSGTSSEWCAGNLEFFEKKSADGRALSIGWKVDTSYGPTPCRLDSIAALYPEQTRGTVVRAARVEALKFLEKKPHPNLNENERKLLLRLEKSILSEDIADLEAVMREHAKNPGALKRVAEELRKDLLVPMHYKVHKDGRNITGTLDLAGFGSSADMLAVSTDPGVATVAKTMVTTTIRNPNTNECKGFLDRYEPTGVSETARALALDAAWCVVHQARYPFGRAGTGGDEYTCRGPGSTQAPWASRA